MKNVKDSASGSKSKPITVPDFVKSKAAGRRLVMLTAYDFPSALLADGAGVDAILVGDSVGTTVLGYETTVPVTMDEMLHHVKAVRKGVTRALLIADLPFGAYQADPVEAFHNAARLIKEGGAHAVKLEGGISIAPTIKLLTEAGIPVMGHIGLTPQSVFQLGGHRAQGKTAEAATRLLEDAAAVEAAGAFGIVLEGMPAELSARISAQVSVPTIGIGAGPGCDGQVQVWHDILGLLPGKPFRHAKRYTELNQVIHKAIEEYAEEVRSGDFPTKEHSI
jgi:3-methyl-2-oxobutanoate hydroxymethyltransferase